MSIQKSVGAAAVAGMLLSASAAQATTIDLKWNGFEGGLSSTVTVASGSPSAGPLTVNSGPFAMEDDATGDTFIAWCIDILETIVAGPTEYTVLGESDIPDGLLPQITAANMADIDRLFSVGSASALTSATLGAAFQVALWEIVYETSGTYDVTAGNFVASGNAAVTSDAATYLSSLGAAPGVFDLTFYASVDPGGRQDLVSGERSPDPLTPVPLPAGMVLLLSGLGLVAGARKLQARRDA